MPIFEYRCQACGATFEQLTSRSDADRMTCTACGSTQTERLLSRFGVSVRTKACGPCESSCDTARMAPPCAAGGCPRH